MVTGFWGKKIGMTQVFSGNDVVPVTVVDLSRWFVTAIKTEQRDGYSAVQVGFTRKRYEQDAFSAEWLKKTSKYFQFVREIRLGSPVADTVKIGQEADFAEQFAEGSFVDVTGITKGCGFAGVFRRHGFSGGRGSHGSKLGRKPGSNGFLRARGKVIKGKKLPGHMGVVQRTMQHLEVVRISKDEKYVLIKGSVPGKAGTVVFVQQGVKS